MATTNKKISELDEAGSLNGNEQAELLQVGNNVRATLTKIKDWIIANLVPDFIQFNTDPPTVTAAGTILWNKNEYTIDINTGLGATIQVGQETLILYHNNTGFDITNGEVLHPIGAVVIGGVTLPTPELAIANDFAKCEGTLTRATHDIANGEIGLATRFGQVRDVDTSGFTPGQTFWLSATVAGAITAIRPSFPNYAISLGGTLNSELAPDGVTFSSVTRSIEDTFNDGWDGAIRESFNFLVTSDGADVIGTLTNIDPLLDLTLMFSDGFTKLDTTTVPLTVGLTEGTDSATITNYVYILKSTKVLTISTSAWPTDEYCKVAQLEVQSAATVLSEGGAERNQNINNHIKKEDDNGHIIHICDWIRDQNATWKTGTGGSLTGTPTNGYIQVTSGTVRQFHIQSVDSFSMPTRDIIIRNDFVTANRRTDNLNTIDAYSDGSSWNNEWGTVVIYGVANKSGEADFVKLNLPSDGYNSEANAISDALGYADKSIAEKDKGVGYLIAAFTVRISGGVVTYNGGLAYRNLRGDTPSTSSGTGGGSGITTYLEATDTPSTRVGKDGYEIIVNESSNIDEYVEKKLAGTGIANGGISDAAQTIVGAKVLKGEADQDAKLVIQNVTTAFNTIFDLMEAGDDFGVVGNNGVRSQSNGADNTFEILGGTGTSVVTLLIIDRVTGKWKIPQTPTTDTTNNDILTWNNTSKAIEKRSIIEVFQLSCSDLITDLTTGTTKAYFRTPYAMIVTEVRASVLTAPTGASLVVDINESGTTILSTKLSIDISEKTSETAAAPPVISDASLVDDAEITIDIDQIGSTIAGAGLIVTLKGYKS